MKMRKSCPYLRSSQTNAGQVDINNCIVDAIRVIIIVVFCLPVTGLEEE